MAHRPDTLEISADDRVRGVLLGLAAGDRNGGPLQMALQLAGSLTALGRFDGSAVLASYLSWWNAGGFDTGPIAAQVFTLVSAGVAPEQAVERVHRVSGGQTAGCNPAHRSVSLAMAAFLTDGQLARAAMDDAALTHADPLAGDAAAAVVTLCRALIRGVPWAAALEQACVGRMSATVAAFEPTGEYTLHRDGFAPHTLQTAMHFVDQSEAFGPALHAAIAFAGPANYCPVLVAAIGGARWGACQIEPSLLQHCTFVPQVQHIANQLAQGWLREHS